MPCSRGIRHGNRRVNQARQGSAEQREETFDTFPRRGCQGRLHRKERGPERNLQEFPSGGKGTLQEEVTCKSPGLARSQRRDVNPQGWNTKSEVASLEAGEMNRGHIFENLLRQTK